MDEFLILHVVVPRVVGEISLAKMLNAATEVFSGSLAGGSTPGNEQGRISGRAGQRIADAAESTATGGDLRIKHLVELADWEGQIGSADDAGNRRAVARVARVGDRSNKLDLTDRLHVVGTVGAIADPALHEDGGDDVHNDGRNSNPLNHDAIENWLCG